MELRVEPVLLPEQILFNYEELKTELVKKTEEYSTLVYTDDQIKDAKADRASLNKLKKALNDERIRQEKQYMVPFNDFKAKMNELIGIIDKAVANSDKQIKEYEQKKKEDKKQELRELWNGMEHPEELRFEDVFMDRMLNSSCHISTVKQCFDDAVLKWDRDIKTLEELPEFSFEAIQIYKETKDFNRAIVEAKRMTAIRKAKEEAEKEKQPEPVVTQEEIPVNPLPINPPEYHMEAEASEREWISFAAYLSKEEAMKLGRFFKENGIQFKPV